MWVSCKSEPQPHPGNISAVFTDLQRHWHWHGVFPEPEATNRTPCRGEGQQREGPSGPCGNLFLESVLGPGPVCSGTRHPVWQVRSCLAVGGHRGSSSPASERPRRPGQRAGRGESASLASLCHLPWQAL